MPKILLSTLNARYIHAAAGLRYLLANLGNLQAQSEIIEFDIQQDPRDIAEKLIGKEPSIIGFGVYIWNTTRTHEVVSILKKVAPHIKIVLGGPEVSYESNTQPIVELADYVITGEADVAFKEVCDRILSGDLNVPKISRAKLPELKSLKLPYSLYSDTDLAHRFIYIEASRGCPFTCEFCLSSVDIPVRQFDTDKVLSELDALIQRGAKTFKFVDRTFNLNIRTSIQILNFFLDRMHKGLFVHFEMVPDRFPPALRSVVERFPAGSLQLEVGIQTFNPTVGGLIGRRQDYDKLQENLRYLRSSTTAHIHADLIVGLPGETLQSFGEGFDTLVKIDPHEIQVGMLKRLRGTPIIRHDKEWEMQYSEDPPYEILSTKTLCFSEVQSMRRFSKYWDLISNSGNFLESKSLLWRDAESPFVEFRKWSEWLFSKVKTRTGIELKALTTFLFEYLTQEKKLESEIVGLTLTRDYIRGGRADLPKCLSHLKPRKISMNTAAPDRNRRQSLAMTGNDSNDVASSRTYISRI